MFSLLESINDRGILKAMFVVGIPGAGKSYTTSQLSGGVAPRIVNTDRASEFLGKKLGKTVDADTWRELFSDKSKKTTTESLSHYLNGMLPLFVDGTSSDASNVLARAGLLESLGYDVGMIFVSTNPETAKKRAKERAEKIGRSVSPEFIDKVFERSEADKDYFSSKFDFFKEFKNDGELDSAALAKLYKEVQAFFNSDVKNPVGKRTIEKLKNSKEKYLVPELFTQEALKNKLDSWYRTKS